jgi:DNA transformation protein
MEKIRNLGPKTQTLLAAIGIHTRQDLQALGAVEVYRRLKAAFPERVSLNALYSLEAALVDLDWRDLPPGRKAELRAEIGGQ